MSNDYQEDTMQAVEGVDRMKANLADKVHVLREARDERNRLAELPFTPENREAYLAQKFLVQDLYCEEQELRSRVIAGMRAQG